jgi:hypothetical protein
LETNIVVIILIALLGGLAGGFGLSYVIYQPQVQSLLSTTTNLQNQVADLNMDFLNVTNSLQNQIQNLMNKTANLTNQIANLTNQIANLTVTRVQEESLHLQYQHVWFSASDNLAEAAIMIINTGGTNVVLQNIAVRGQSVPIADMFYYVPTLIADLSYVAQTGNLTTPPTNTPAFQTISSAIVLGSGKTVVIYIFSNTASGSTFAPGSVTVNDVGLTIAMSVFTAQATYYKETNVQAG